MSCQLTIGLVRRVIRQISSALTKITVYRMQIYVNLTHIHTCWTNVQLWAIW